MERTFPNADALELWCKEEHASTANYRIQQAIDQLTAWTEDWCVTVNKDKSSTTLFTISPKKQASPIKIGTHTLKEEDEATYLVVTFNKRLPWKPYTLRKEGKARKLALMRKLAGTTWGANEQILKTVLEYSSTAWSTTAKTNQPSLDNIQNQALRIITGAMKSTPITFMEQTTAIQPLQQRRQAKVLLQAEKYKCLTDHPMKEKVEGRTKNKIKRCSFTHEVKKLQKDYPAVLTIRTLPRLHQPP